MIFCVSPPVRPKSRPAPPWRDADARDSARMAEAHAALEAAWWRCGEDDSRDSPRHAEVHAAREAASYREASHRDSRVGIIESNWFGPHLCCNRTFVKLPRCCINVPMKLGPSISCDVARNARDALQAQFEPLRDSLKAAEHIARLARHIARLARQPQVISWIGVQPPLGAMCPSA